MGDGESMEGNIWEALNFAGHYKLNNLCAIIDVNRWEWSRDLNTGLWLVQNIGLHSSQPLASSSLLLPIIFRYMSNHISLDQTTRIEKVDDQILKLLYSLAISNINVRLYCRISCNFWLIWSWQIITSDTRHLPPAHTAAARPQHSDLLTLLLLDLGLCFLLMWRDGDVTRDTWAVTKWVIFMKFSELSSDCN